MPGKNEHDPSLSLPELSQRRMRLVYETAISRLKSPSHDQNHIDLVLARARELAVWGINNGLSINWECLYTAGCLHDLGRDDPHLHGLESIEASIAQAEPILRDSGYSETEITQICQIIREHDQPDSTASNLEALILREADFLAGFGAWGILRTCTWGGESGRSIEEILTALRDRMPARIASLQLPPSQETAFKEWPLVNLLLAQLGKQGEARESKTCAGKYIVFEGTSGAGKDTQAKLLATFLENRGTSVAVIKEPSDFGRKMLKMAKKSAEQSGRQISQLERAFILAADRVNTVAQMETLLHSGHTVIKIRSFLTAMAYQGESELAMAEVLFLNNLMVPRPDLVFLLDVGAEEAMQRINRRHREEGTPIGDFEELEKLKKIASRFRQAVAMIPGLPVELIPADASREEVFAIIIDVIQKKALL